MRGERWTLFTLWLLVFGSASQVMIIALLLPNIAQALDVRPELLGTLMTAYAVALGLAALVAGPISDRVGRRRILIFGAAAMTLALLLHGLADSYGVLFLVRVLAGLAGGVLSGASVAFVGDCFPSHRRGWANGWIMSGMAAGQIAGIPLGTLAAEHYGFRAPFLGFAAAMAVALLLTWKSLPQPQVPLSRQPLTLAGASAGYLRLLRRPSAFAASLAFLLIFLGISLFVIYLPTWLLQRQGFVAGDIALLYFLGGLANVLAGPGAGKLSDRVGRRQLILWSSLAIAVVTLAIPVSQGTPASIYPLFFLMMASFASRASPLQALLTEIVDGEERGSLMSLTTATGQIGFGLGGALAGPTFASWGFGANALLATVAAVATAVLIWRYLPEAPTDQLESQLTLRPQGALCGPCPEAGHMPGPWQDQCAEKRWARLRKAS